MTKIKTLQKFVADFCTDECGPEAIQLLGTMGQPNSRSHWHFEEMHGGLRAVLDANKDGNRTIATIDQDGTRCDCGTSACYHIQALVRLIGEYEMPPQEVIDLYWR